jgi:hypothetical protein
MAAIEKVKPEVTIDARGPRWSAVITTIVLSIALITSNIWVILFQTIVFAIGALRGPQFTPYAFVYKKLIKPRLKSEVTFEDVRPPRFAKSIGLGFALVAVIASVTGAGGVFTVAVGFALAAAFLNAAFNFCLGCQVYLLLLRARVGR